MIFSMPIEAICSFGTLADRSALPSLVQTTKVPVSATAKLQPVMPGVGVEDQRAGRLALRFRQVVDVAVVGIGADRACEYLRHVGAQLVHGGHDDMARILVVELLDALAEIGLDHLDADRGHVRPEAALLGEHRLALDERLGAMVAQDAVDDLVVLGGVARPMHVDAVRSRIGLELVEILVEMGERVLLDRRSERPKLLPFGNAVHLAVALLPQVPEPLVMHLLVLGSGDEARGGLCLVDRPVAVDPAPRGCGSGGCGRSGFDAPSA